MFPMWLQAWFWGLVGGSALLVGAATGYFVKIPQRGIAAIMAFGAGVLISAVSFELMDEAYKRGGFDSTAIGFLGGAAISLFSHFSGEIIAATTAIAAGAILAMLTDTMIPEAFEQAHDESWVDYCMGVSRRLCLE